MSTIAKTILPVPDSVVVGSGSYTIPADRYGFISMSTTSVSAASVQANGSVSNFRDAGSGSGSGSANNNHQYLNAGSTISTASSSPTGSNTPFGSSVRTTNGYAIIYLNGSQSCISYSAAQCSASMYSSSQLIMHTYHASTVGWSVALFRIPKNNLPTGAAEGE